MSVSLLALHILTQRGHGSLLVHQWHEKKVAEIAKQLARPHTAI